MNDFTTPYTDELSKNAGNLNDKLSDTRDEIRRRAGEALDASSDVAREKLSQLADGVKDAASKTTERMNEQVGAKQSAGADYLSRVADSIRISAKAFEQDVPFAARGIDVAADFISDASEKVRNGSVQDLIDGAKSFARSQPAAFLGLTVLAGFAGVRFLKAGGESESRAALSSSVDDKGV